MLLVVRHEQLRNRQRARAQHGRGCSVGSDGSKLDALRVAGNGLIVEPCCGSPRSVEAAVNLGGLLCERLHPLSVELVDVSSE